MFNPSSVRWDAEDNTNHFQKIWKSYFLHIEKSSPQLHLKKKNSTDLHAMYNIEVYQDLLKKH